MTDVAPAVEPKMSTPKAKVAPAGLIVRKIYAPDGGSFVSCNCGCGDKAASATLYHAGLLKCSKGGPTRAFLDTFKVVETIQPSKKGAKRKTPEASSKANTPTKEGADKENEEAEATDESAAPKTKVPKAKAPKAAAAEKPAKKAKKDDGIPKKPPSAWVLFSCEQRTKIKEETPDMPQSEVLKKIGLLWQGMSEEDKKPYNDQADQGKAEHVEKYGLSEAKQKAAAKKAAPAKPLSGYMMFCAATRESVKTELPGLVGKEVMTYLGAKWKELSVEDKEMWNKKSKDAKDAFKDGECNAEEKEESKAEKEEKEEDEEKEDEEKEEEEKEEEKEEGSEEMEEDEGVAATQATQEDAE